MMDDLKHVQIDGVGPSKDGHHPPAAAIVIGPPENIEPAAVYRLYRGTVCEINGQRHRLWAEFTKLELRWAAYDTPARFEDHLSLLEISSCKHDQAVVKDGADVLGVEIAAAGDRMSAAPGLTVMSCADGFTRLAEFATALMQLLASRDTEGDRGLYFIQRRLFQYLWLRQVRSLSENELYEAQAVLAFNLDPKEGVAYLKRKAGKSTDAEVGEWLARMATEKGGLDPTMLGGYFSRKDTLEVFRAFVAMLDFGGTDIVGALRKFFDTFKPGGEGQVITRILEYFSEAYYVQWQRTGDGLTPRTSYIDADSVFKVAVSLIMLNTSLHVATKKISKKNFGVAMTLEAYIENTRRVVSKEEAPNEVLRQWYDAVKDSEISVEPMPRAIFSNLPVQPDIEGWLTLILNNRKKERLWAVLALQRLYLFSDANEVEPVERIDLKDTSVLSLAADAASRERLRTALRPNRSRTTICSCFSANSVRLPQEESILADAEERAFEILQLASQTPMLQRSSEARNRLVLVAETQDLMERWVSLISSGPY